ncbi:MAG TPA: hypothetical protein VHV10_09345 [Ktedonobacteraceae bacterium]|jgi:hypothetical protein|nr:hypothetical protein [Ktedonobacteraceae bacterium]
MDKQSRRNFIQRSLGTAILTTASASGLALTNSLDASAANSNEGGEVTTTQAKVEVSSPVYEISDPVVAYIRKGEVSILMGEKEIVYTDHKVVQNLMKVLPLKVLP